LLQIKGTKLLDHTLFHGPPGLGKTTLAILANELRVGIKITSGPVLDKPGECIATYSI
jgi:Holliday junction DNA helicase RuvB